MANEKWNKKVPSRWRKTDSDCADITSSGRSFQALGPATENEDRTMSTAESLTDGTTKRLVLASRMELGHVNFKAVACFVNIIPALVRQGKIIMTTEF